MINGEGSRTDNDEKATRLAREAALRLRHIQPDEPRSANRLRAVQAAIAIDEVVRLLRGADSGRTVILELLRDAASDSVPSDVLRHASGIQEFARRIRELRDDGYDIRATGSGYRLVGLRSLDESAHSRIAGTDLGRDIETGSGVRISFAGSGTATVHPLHDGPKEEAQVWTYRVTGRPGLMVDVRIAEHPNGDTQIAAVDAYDSHECFRELENRLRHGIYRHNGHSLMRIRRTYKPRDDRVKQRRADSVDELTEHAGVDIKAELSAAGATAVGTRRALGLLEPTHEQKQITVIAPTDARNDVMLLAYVLTTIVPLGRMLNLLDRSGS